MRLMILIAATLLVAASPAPARESAGGKIEWRTDLTAALSDARAAGKPLFLYFTHDC